MGLPNRQLEFRDGDRHSDAEPCTPASAAIASRLPSDALVSQVAEPGRSGGRAFGRNHRA